MRILITGGSGFLGSHLADLLLDRGHEVICVDNLITGSKDNIGHLLRNPRFTFTQWDVSEPLEMSGPLDYVAHLASPASPVDYNRWPVETLKAGALGTLHVLELASRNDAGFLLASTSEVYGDPEVSPQREDYWGHVNPIGPRSQYDEAKRFAEALTMAFHRARGARTRIARIFNTYGPRMRGNDGRAVPAFINQALKGRPITIFGDGSQTRSFCYVSDLVDGLHRLMSAEVTGPVNLGNPHEITVLELARKVLELTGSSARLEYMPPAPDDPRRRRPDISRAKELLEWEPRVPLEKGLRETIAWFRSRLP